MSGSWRYLPVQVPLVFTLSGALVSHHGLGNQRHEIYELSCEPLVLLYLPDDNFFLNEQCSVRTYLPERYKCIKYLAGTNSDATKKQSLKKKEHWEQQTISHNLGYDKRKRGIMFLYSLRVQNSADVCAQAGTRTSVTG